jgi:hypothetical protein
MSRPLEIPTLAVAESKREGEYARSHCPTFLGLTTPCGPGERIKAGRIGPSPAAARSSGPDLDLAG